MAQLLPYELLIDDAPIQGYALTKLATQFGDDAAASIDRVARANAATFPSFEYDPVLLFIKAVTAAIQAGSYEQPIEAHTSGDTLEASESGSEHTNAGASGTITIVLPAATVGQWFVFRVSDAFELRLDPNGSETIGMPSTGVQGAAGKYLVADAVGEWVKLKCLIAETWTAQGYAGTWTAEG